MPLSGQLINVLAAIMLLIAFAMLSQRRILSLIELFAWQGVVLAASTFIVAYSTGQSHLYISGVLTVALKVVALPWILFRLIHRLNVRWDVETLINIPTLMIIGILLVICAFDLALPVAKPTRWTPSSTRRGTSTGLRIRGTAAGRSTLRR